MSGGGISRRALLRVLAGGAVAGAWVAPWLPAAAEATAPDAAVASALVRIGRRYVALVPGEGELATLRRLLGHASGADVLSDASAFEAAVARDFARGDVFAVDGWVLARTELRAAALFALTTP